MWLKVADCQPATLLKRNFFKVIFQGFWQQISGRLFSRTPLKWLILQRCIQDLVKMKLFCESNYGLKPWTILQKSSILDVSQGSVYTSVLKLQVLFIKRTSSKFIVTHFDVMLSKNLELLCDCMFATNTKTIIYIT